MPLKPLPGQTPLPGGEIEKSVPVSGYILEGWEFVKIHRKGKVIDGDLLKRTLLFPLYNSDKLEFVGFPFQKTRVHLGWKESIVDHAKPNLQVPNYKWTGLLKKTLSEEILEPPLFGRRLLLLYPFGNLWEESPGNLSWVAPETSLFDQIFFLDKEIQVEPRVLPIGNQLSIYYVPLLEAIKTHGKINSRQTISWGFLPSQRLNFTLVSKKNWEKENFELRGLKALNPQSFVESVSLLFNESFFKESFFKIQEKWSSSGNDLFKFVLLNFKKTVATPLELLSKIPGELNDN